MERSIRIAYSDGKDGYVERDYINTHSNSGHPEKSAEKRKTCDDAEILRLLISHSTVEGRYQYKDKVFDSWIIEPGQYEICGEAVTLFSMRILVGNHWNAMCSAKIPIEECVRRI